MADIDPVIDPIIGSITTVDNKTEVLDEKFPVEDVEGTFQQINASLASLNNSIKDHETRLAVVEPAVWDLQTKVDAHETRITDLEKV